MFPLLSFLVSQSLSFQISQFTSFHSIYRVKTGKLGNSHYHTTVIVASPHLPNIVQVIPVPPNIHFSLQVIPVEELVADYEETLEDLKGFCKHLTHEMEGNIVDNIDELHR